MTAEPLTGEQQLEAVKKGLEWLEAGANAIDCPYCNARVLRGADFCCKTMVQAVAAILRAQATQELMDEAARIADNAGAL